MTNNKIEQAKSILSELGLPLAQQNKICALTFLALCGIKPDSSWKDASSNSLTLTKGIMAFVNNYYEETYRPNTRESFRKIAINPFIRYQIVDLNPDDPTLPPQSSKTHYAIKQGVVDTIRKYGTDRWSKAVEVFVKFQFPENIKETTIISKVRIRNYKSIESIDLDLGRFNVFIGANGSGKSNILEAIAMISASKNHDLDLDGLMDRGVRIAKPMLTLSSFFKEQQKKAIEVMTMFKDGDQEIELRSLLVSADVEDLYSKWIDREQEEDTTKIFRDFVEEIFEDSKNKSKEEIQKDLDRKLEERHKYESSKYSEIISEYLIYNLETKVLRGLNAYNRKSPLGINGEGLDILISNFNKFERDQLLKCKVFFDWLEGIEFDKSDQYKLTGHKLGKSTSLLYFHDKFMQSKNNLFSAENSNEGILHVIFYLALFISNKTPSFFAIDNIETALNPRLCRTLVKELVLLTKQRGKQVLVTTHNPAILDGLNLHDSSQRLFEVYRSDGGRTEVRRIKFKPNAKTDNLKLSEMWMEGLLGAVPKHF